MIYAMREIKDVDITHLSTFRLPSRAARLVTLESLEDVEHFFSTDAHALSDTFYLIGEGSNTILPPHVACVVRLKFSEDGARPYGKHVWKIISQIPAEDVVSISADQCWDDTVRRSIEKGYAGLEALAAIPGTVGAAPVQNIGAYGREFSDVCHSVCVFDREEMRFKTILRSECDFGYRTSIFKKNKNRYIVVSVNILLGHTVHIPDYPGVKEAAKGVKGIDPVRIGPRDIYKAITRLRWSKLPRPDIIPNVGSCFENPIVEKAKAEELKVLYPDMPLYSMDKIHAQESVVKISAGWLIDSCGLKGFCMGGVCVYEKHALIMIHPDNKGTIDDVRSLVTHIQKEVRNRFGIDLALEPNLVE